VIEIAARYALACSSSGVVDGRGKGTVADSAGSIPDQNRNCAGIRIGSSEVRDAVSVELSVVTETGPSPVAELDLFQKTEVPDPFETYALTLSES